MYLLSKGQEDSRQKTEGKQRDYFLDDTVLIKTAVLAFVEKWKVMIAGGLEEQ